MEREREKEREREREKGREKYELPGNLDEKIDQPTIRVKWTRRHNLRNYEPSYEVAAQLCTCIYRLNCMTTGIRHDDDDTLGHTHTHTHTRVYYYVSRGLKCVIRGELE